MTTHPAPCEVEAVFSCAHAQVTNPATARNKGRNLLRELLLSAEANWKTGFFIVQSSLQLLWGCVSYDGGCLDGLLSESRMRKPEKIARRFQYYFVSLLSELAAGKGP